MDPVTVECIQEKAQSALEEYERFQYLTHQPFRFGRLLLRLPRLKSVTPHTLQQFFFPHMSDSRTCVEHLIKELLLRGPPPSAFSSSGLRDRSLMNTFDLGLNELSGSTVLTPSFVSPFLSNSGYESDINLHPPDSVRKCCWVTNSQVHTDLTGHHSLPSLSPICAKYCQSDTGWFSDFKNPFLLHPTLLGYGQENTLKQNEYMDHSKLSMTGTSTTKDRITVEDANATTEANAFAPIQGKTLLFPVDKSLNSHPKEPVSGLARRIISTSLSQPNNNGSMTEKPTNTEQFQSPSRTVTTDLNPLSFANSCDSLDVLLKTKMPAGPTTTTRGTTHVTCTTDTAAHRMSPSIHTNPSIANPASLQLYYAVMRHQLTLLQRHSTCMSLPNKQTE